jgi:predicted O-linked N-acetylglucosamine transferase (SPINDLY family)
MTARSISSAEANFLRGNDHAQRGQWPAALASYDLAIALSPTFVLAHFNRGVALQQLRQLDAACASYAAAVTLDPTYALGWFNRGVVLQQMRRLEEALSSYQGAIAAQADYAEAYCNRGNILVDLDRVQEAIASYDAALALRPRLAGAWFNRGNALKSLGRREPALASYERSLELDPGYADALYNRGNVLMELRHLEAAVASFDAAIARRPEHAGTHMNRGNALVALKRYEEAIASYERVLALQPQFDFAAGPRRAALMDICDWRDFDAACAELALAVDRGERVCSPFLMLSVSGSAARQRRAAEIWAHAKYPAAFDAFSAVPRLEPGSGKIRLGYFSADLRNHPVGALTAALFESHDRTAFETTAFSFGPVTQDPLRSRLESAFDRFIDVHGYSDREIVALARELKIDIAVDLMGYTDGCRPGVFAGRVAPLQIGYLGYLGTLALNLDYLVADPTLVPPDQRKHYTEKILYLPWYQPNDPGRAVPPVSDRREFGLPDRAFVFCCFNSSFKINPETFASWMRILGRAPGSVLWLYAPSAIVRENLTIAAGGHGVAASRLLFAEWMPPADNLRRYRCADLFLDTAPYNAGTTASDALWAALPVITLIGSSFAGRVAASVLSAADLPELIKSTRDEYEDLAVALAADAARLTRIRDRLDRDRHELRLFDTPRHTAALEAAYRSIYARGLAGEAPAHVEPGEA